MCDKGDETAGRLSIVLAWDERSLEHVLDHGVSRLEVEQTISDDKAIKTRTDVKGRYAVYGQTTGGRYLVVFIDTIDPKQSSYHPVTAYDMDHADRKRYARLLGRK